MEMNLTKENFETEVMNSEGLVLVDFWASWCGPCKRLAPVLTEVAERNEGTIKVGKVNVDEAMALAQAFQVASIPTLILFKDGKPIKKEIGFQSLDQIEKLWK